MSATKPPVPRPAGIHARETTNAIDHGMAELWPAYDGMDADEVHEDLRGGLLCGFFVNELASWFVDHGYRAPRVRSLGILQRAICRKVWPA